MLLESLTLLCFYRIRTEGSAAPYSLYLCTSSGKLATGLVPVHSSASLLSRICGPPVQNELLYLWGPQASSGVACCFSSIYSVGTSTLHLPWEAFACPSPRAGWLACLCSLPLVHFQPCRANASPSLASVLMLWLCPSSPLVTQTCQLRHQRCWENYLRSFLQ